MDNQYQNTGFQQQPMAQPQQYPQQMQAPPQQQYGQPAYPQQQPQQRHPLLNIEGIVVGFQGKGQSNKDGRIANRYSIELEDGQGQKGWYTVFYEVDQTGVEVTKPNLIKPALGQYVRLAYSLSNKTNLKGNPYKNVKVCEPKQAPQMQSSGWGQYRGPGQSPMPQGNFANQNGRIMQQYPQQGSTLAPQSQPGLQPTVLPQTTTGGPQNFGVGQQAIPAVNPIELDNFMVVYFEALKKPEYQQLSSLSRELLLNHCIGTFYANKRADDPIVQGLMQRFR